MKHAMRKTADGRTAATYGTGCIVGKTSDGRLLRAVTMRDLVIRETKRVQELKERQRVEAADNAS